MPDRTRPTKSALVRFSPHRPVRSVWRHLSWNTGSSGSPRSPACGGGDRGNDRHRGHHDVTFLAVLSVFGSRLMADGEHPKNVKDLLVEAKDASELMVDLAYAAVFFNEENLAEEVEKLEERMDASLRRL